MRTLIGIARLIAQAVYTLMRLAPRRHKVVFLSRQGDSPSRDFLLLVEELQRRDSQLEIVVLCRTIQPGFRGSLSYGTELLAQLFHLSTASVCIADGYIIPVSLLNHGRDFTVLQMWHALGAIKRFGYQCLDTPEGRPSKLASSLRMHSNYDVVLCGGPGAVPFFSAAFGIDPERVLPIGLPRIDYLIERARQTELGLHPEPLADLLQRHPQLLDRSLTRILYAPTFRRDHATRLHDFADRFDPDRHVLLVKPHNLERAEVDAAPHLVDATGISVLDLLPFCDVLITDYSAVAFEAYALEKPVYYYVYDIEEYEEGCGLNIDPLRELAANSSVELSDIVRSIDAGAYDELTARRIAARHLPTPLEGSTVRIAQLVLDRLRGADRS